MPFQSLTFAIKILWTGSESSKTTKPKFGSFPPTPLVLMRSSTTFPKPVKIYITPRVKYFNRILCSFNCWREINLIYLNHFKTKDTSCYIQWQPRHIHSFVIHVKMPTTSLAAYFVIFCISPLQRKVTCMVLQKQWYFLFLTYICQKNPIPKFKAESALASNLYN